MPHTDELPKISRLRALTIAHRFVRTPLAFLNDQLAQHGDTLRTYIGGLYPALLTVRPEIIQHVLQKNWRNYQKSPVQFDVMAHYLGRGLLTSEGDYWLRQRRLIQPGFHRRRLEGLTAIMNEVIADRLAKVDARKRSHDLYTYMTHTAFHIMARSLFSSTVRGDDLEALSDIITQLQAFMIRQIRQPFLGPWFRLSGQIKKHERLAGRSEAIIRRHIRARQRSGDRPDDLLQMLLDSRYPDTGEAMSERQLLDETTILLVAGHETSACALAWTFYLLAKHPRVTERLQRELAEVLGDRRPAFTDLSALTYTRQVIEESMRLYPPAWITDRVAVADDEVNGVQIPAGTIVILYIYGAHRNPQTWDQPAAFRPERFAPSHKDEQHPFQYLPFGGGPRLCIGNHFAMMEMQLVLAHWLRRFRPEALPDAPAPEPLPLITLRPAPGVQIGLHPLH